MGRRKKQAPDSHQMDKNKQDAEIKNEFAHPPILGTKIKRIDAFDKVTGKAIYGHDIKLPGMLYGKILHSIYPHALIKGIDTSRAKSIKGVKCVLTASDVSCRPLGLYKDQPVLKGDKVRSIKDEIAAVAATTPEAAEEACRAIKVDYEPLKAVFDPFEAIKLEAPRIHENAPYNMVPGKYEFKSGNVQEALEKSEFIVEGTYRTPPVAYGLIEPSWIIAYFSGDNRLTVWSSTQTPFLMQNTISKIIGLPGHKIRIIQPVIGGSFGRNLDVLPFEIIAILLAKATGCPVKITYSMEEEFSCSPIRQSMVIKMTTGCTLEGQLTARSCEATLDAGAYSSSVSAIAKFILLPVTSLYKVENVYFRARSIYTNNPPSGAFPGFGSPQITFAIEQQMDELAQQAGIDPVTFRIINANKPNSITPQKIKITSCGLKDCIQKASERIGFDRKREKWEGVGIASAIHLGAGARVHPSDGSGAIVKIDDFGGVTIITGATETGTGTLTTIAAIASHELGIPIEKIRVINGDTSLSVWDTGDFAARNTFTAGNCVLFACKKLRKKIIEKSAEILQCHPDSVQLSGGSAYCAVDRSKHIPVDKIVRTIHFTDGNGCLLESSYYEPPSEAFDKNMSKNISSAYSFSTCAVRIKIDPASGKIKLLKIVVVIDAGTVINRAGADAVVMGLLHHGLGFAIYENMHLRNGRIINCNFKDYGMLKSNEMPEDIEIHYVETVDPLGPYGAKGISEVAVAPIAAAIANAVANATESRVRSLPITPSKLLGIIKSVI